MTQPVQDIQGTPGQPTPPEPSQPTQPPQPSAPLKSKRPEPHVAWADMVDGMDTMPVQEAKRLKPKDIGVQFGPIMTEEQFEAYQKARGNRAQVIR